MAQTADTCAGLRSCWQIQTVSRMTVIHRIIKKHLKIKHASNLPFSACLSVHKEAFCIQSLILKQEMHRLRFGVYLFKCHLSFYALSYVAANCIFLLWEWQHGAIGVMRNFIPSHLNAQMTYSLLLLVSPDTESTFGALGDLIKNGRALRGHSLQLLYLYW